MCSYSNADDEVLDADAAWWAYSPGREAIPAAEVDITKEIKKTIKKDRVEFKIKRLYFLFFSIKIKMFMENLLNIENISIK